MFRSAQVKVAFEGTAVFALRRFGASRQVLAPLVKGLALLAEEHIYAQDLIDALELPFSFPYATTVQREGQESFALQDAEFVAYDEMKQILVLGVFIDYNETFDDLFGLSDEETRTLDGEQINFLVVDVTNEEPTATAVLATDEHRVVGPGYTCDAHYCKELIAATTN